MKLTSHGRTGKRSAVALHISARAQRRRPRPTCAQVATILNSDQLQQANIDVADKNAKYVVEYFCAERWPYDERARLMGEEVFQIGEAKVSKVEADDYLTVEQRNAAVRRFLPR